MKHYKYYFIATSCLLLSFLISPVLSSAQTSKPNVPQTQASDPLQLLLQTYARLLEKNDPTATVLEAVIISKVTEQTKISGWRIYINNKDRIVSLTNDINGGNSSGGNTYYDYYPTPKPRPPLPNGGNGILPAPPPPPPPPPPILKDVPTPDDGPSRFGICTPMESWVGGKCLIDKDSCTFFGCCIWVPDPDSGHTGHGKMICFGIPF